MAGNYVQVVPDSTGKKIDATLLPSDTDTVARQIVDLGDNKGTQLLETLLLLLAETREIRRLVCEATDEEFNERLEL